MKLKIGRALLVIFRPLIFLLFPYKLIGRELIPKDCRPLVLCCNHISMIDPVFLLLGCRRPIFFMGKEELFHNRLLAWFLRELFGVFSVSRGKGDSGAIEKAMSIVRKGNVMGIFPEGTRSKDGTLGRAKSGAALIISQTGADMLPCAVFSKTGHVRMFRKTTVVYGKTMTPQQLHLDGEKPELRYASRKIMNAISGLIEENSHASEEEQVQ